MMIKGIKVFMCKPYSCRMTKDACNAMQKRAKMKPTKILFMHWNELKFCRDCKGVKE